MRRRGEAVNLHLKVVKALESTGKSMCEILFLFHDLFSQV